MDETNQQPARRYRRVEQKLQDLIRKNQSKQLSGPVSGTSEETASLFSAGTTPAVRVWLDDW